MTLLLPRYPHTAGTPTLSGPSDSILATGVLLTFPQEGQQKNPLLTFSQPITQYQHQNRKIEVVSVVRMPHTLKSVLSNVETYSSSSILLNAAITACIKTPDTAGCCGPRLMSE